MRLLGTAPARNIITICRDAKSGTLENSNCEELAWVVRRLGTALEPCPHYITLWTEHHNFSLELSICFDANKITYMFCHKTKQRLKLDR